MTEKNVKTSGADEKTPSRSEYFSWINNTNEGSTEQQTLANLDFFAYLQRTYGMKLDIYAWDAGNLDGAHYSYEREDSEKLKKQYPHGFAPVVERAKSIGTRMGIWGGADGYGDTAEEIAARRKLLVGFCKNYAWALFKFDNVCGYLRPEMRKEFAETMRRCREYSPDLILLNHRVEFGEEEKYATTFLWEGQETYVDVHEYNKITAPHNRAFVFFRGHTPKMRRLTEDHGVCISSSIDFFEDDLVYQAFNRCLILAPEIYGNPWFMRDDELPVLARIYNLHRRYRDILTEGTALPEAFGENAVIRGNGKRLFLSTGCASWEGRTVKLKLDEKISLLPCKRVTVLRHFPSEEYIGTFPCGEEILLYLPPFRAALFEICDAEIAEPVITGCSYETLHEKENGTIDRINVLSSSGEIGRYYPSLDKSEQILHIEKFDVSLRDPNKLGVLNEIAAPADAERLYETACFAMNADSLERQSLARSGESDIPEVIRAREEFFSQRSYRLKGTDHDVLFDGNEDTVYDTRSKIYENFDGRIGYRVCGGCLRIDFKGIYAADRIEIEYFDAEGKDPSNFAPQTVLDEAETSLDLCGWTSCPLTGISVMKEETNGYFAYYVDEYREVTGKRKKAIFRTAAPMRYFRLPSPMDRIHSIKMFAGDKELALLSLPDVNNLYAPYKAKPTRVAACGSFTLGELPMHPYLSVACDGVTGNENVTCTAEIDGKTYGFPSRAPAYYANAYEYPVHPVDGFYTFFLPLKKEWKDKEIKITALFAGESVPVTVYLCDGHKKREGVILDF